MPELVPLSGSERSELPSASPAATPLDPSEMITVTVLLRRRAELPSELINTTATVSTQELGDRYGADSADATKVADVLGRYGLTVTEFQLASRRLKVTGMVAAMQAAFGTTLTSVTSEHPDGSGSVTHRYRTGQLMVPAELSGIIVGVLGLDTRPQASPHFRRPAAAPDGAVTAHAASAVPGAVPLTALQVASFYDFPAGTDGTGQTIAIIELGGGYNQADLSTYFSGLSLAVPSVTSVGVDNGSNSPGQAADGEVELDIEVAGAVAPKASFVVYFAPNTDQGFSDAIADALHATPTPIAVSISWGGPESSWSAQSMTAMNEAISDAAALGATVTVAAGDNGSSDNAQSTSGVQVDFPASSPYSLACGGTTLVGNSATNTITSEVVWNEIAIQGGAGGGGVSVVYQQPTWQKTAGVPASAAGKSGIGSAAEPGRGVPDVAGNADPYSGYQVVVDGKPQPIGGTSAVAPLWAGLIARLAQASGTRFGLLQPLLYAGITPGVDVAGFHDIVEGNNGAYKAGPGWDACTGLGSPNGTALLARLTGKPAPTPTPTPPPTTPPGPVDPVGPTSGPGSSGSGSSGGGNTGGW
jgi:kumamolisin